ncbi:hypothetical protein GGH91_003066 [Coemansia sp. RSA 2671]|nr:hypothetical protein GGH91_003066 [Coemansia sp. RSA 2671]
MAVPGTTLFPGLRTLCIGIDYPFCDDTLFRGNAAMLERLELILYSATIDAIRKYAVFTPESHPKLKLVSIDLSPDPRVDLFSSFQEQIQFVLSIAPCATVRRVDGQILARLLPLFADFTSIQVLSLPEMVVNFWDMIALIKSLPLLSDLRTSFPVLGPEHRDIKPNELPSYVAKTFGPISWRFCRWYFCDLDNSVAVAKCVLLLALTCPNFEHINPEHYDDDDFMCAMRELCRTPGFKPFAARLRSLTSK